MSNNTRKWVVGSAGQKWDLYPLGHTGSILERRRICDYATWTRSCQCGLPWFMRFAGYYCVISWVYPPDHVFAGYCVSSCVYPMHTRRVAIACFYVKKNKKMVRNWVRWTEYYYWTLLNGSKVIIDFFFFFMIRYLESSIFRILILNLNFVKIIVNYY